MIPPYIQILLEEESAQRMIEHLSPQILAGTGVQVRCYKMVIKPLRKQNLRKLEERLRIYEGGIRGGRCLGVMILIDQDPDRDDCKDLKQTLESIVQRAGLHTKTNPRGDRFHVVNRIAVDELEAWYFGDPHAVLKAYPRINKNALQKIARDIERPPHTIKGGSKEQLHALMKEAGYYTKCLRQMEIAENLSRHMRPDRNTSPSFQTFIDGMKTLATQLSTPQTAHQTAP